MDDGLDGGFAGEAGVRNNDRDQGRGGDSEDASERNEMVSLWRDGYIFRSTLQDIMPQGGSSCFQHRFEWELTGFGA